VYSQSRPSIPNRLTSAIIDAATSRERPYKLFDGAGLFLLVMPNGGRYWRLKYRFAGKAKSLSLGVYPEVSLAEARIACEDLRAVLADGIDPSVVRKAEHATALARQVGPAARFRLDSDGALAFRFGTQSVVLTPAETGELRAFLEATRAVTPKAATCP
jgi:hypothetical protein